MRILPAVIILFLMIACNNSADTKADTKDTAKQTVQMPDTTITADTVFTGFGTEPFWSVYVVNKIKIVFHPADGADAEVPFVVPLTIDTITSKYVSSNSTTAIELTITKKNCSDGMSEKIHPFEVSLLVNKTNYRGCGRKGN